MSGLGQVLTVRGSQVTHASTSRCHCRVSSVQDSAQEQFCRQAVCSNTYALLSKNTSQLVYQLPC